MRLLRFTFFTLLILILASCTKYEEEMVTGNTPPLDFSISNQVYEDYVTRTYIRVLGREPSTTEFNTALVILRQHSLSKADRLQFLDIVFSMPEYLSHTFSEQWLNVLPNYDTSDVSVWIYVLQIGLDDSTNLPVFPIFYYEQDRLFALQDSILNFYNGSISLVNLHKILINNFLYDQINMGAVNFVVSVFQQYLFRNPTQQEQDASASMVENNYNILFLETGASKSDFINIFFASNDYYEGQVVNLFQKFLFRPPNTIEMNEQTIKYKNTGDYIKLQKEILSMDEFVRL